MVKNQSPKEGGGEIEKGGGGSEGGGGGGGGMGHAGVGSPKNPLRLFLRNNLTRLKITLEVKNNLKRLFLTLF